VTLQVAWWGNDVRAKATQDAIAAFEKDHPNIKVEAQPGSYDGYHDKLSTQIAANAAPDVMQLQGEFMAQYASQGVLLDLKNVSTADLDPGTTANGKRNGAQVAVPTGLSSLVVVVNPKLFTKAGVPLPNDKTWTWDEYAEIAKTISHKAAGVTGAKSSGWDITEVASWVAQRNKLLFTQDGKLGATPDDFASLFAFAKKMKDEGGSPSAAETAEQLSLSPEQSGVATGRYAMQLDAASNFPALEKASGGGLKMLRLPSMTGKPGDNKMVFVASQFWSASARSKHPAEAQQLIDYLVNSPDAGKILGITRSTPANLKVRAAIAPTLSPGDQEVTTFLNEISSEVTPSYWLTAGTNDFTANLHRYTGEVLFGRQTPEKAGQGLFDETKASLKG